MFFTKASSEVDLPWWRSPSACVFSVLVLDFAFQWTRQAIFPMLNHILSGFYRTHSVWAGYYVHNSLWVLPYGLSTLGAVWIVQKYLDRQGNLLRGFSAIGWLRQVCAGLGIGLLVWLLFIGFAWLNGDYLIEGLQRFYTGPVIYLVFAVVVGVIAEEVLFRGYILPTLERRWGTSLAYLLTTSMFAIEHGQYGQGYVSENVVHPVLHAFALGSLLGAAYLVTRTIWFPIGIHFAWNFLGAICFDSRAYNVSSIFHYRLNSHAFLLTGAAYQASAIFCFLAALVLFCVAIRVEQQRKLYPRMPDIG